MAGLGILNVGAGDTKLVFDPDNPADAIRAARIVTDMLRRGYALLIDTGERDGQGRPVYVRAKAFDEKTHEYIVADFDPLIAKDNDEQTGGNDDEQTATPGRAEEIPESHPVRRGRKRLKASETSGVAVPRSSGG